MSSGDMLSHAQDTSAILSSKQVQGEFGYDENVSLDKLSVHDHTGEWRKTLSESSRKSRYVENSSVFLSPSLASLREWQREGEKKEWVTGGAELGRVPLRHSTLQT
ncbi:hypothetical protein RRG08_047701 [Elysia crispata]|uniref:Uncharacterized protein n=1 Tax=Elysia crispata TaxID=231223 RepID=A0AAE1E7T7_9GAST|nr:hypothetical protein RRG08_047701 [Elysia crispata]